MISNILAPIDGSEHTDQVVNVAGELASKTGARLHLFHVLSEGGVPQRLLQLAEKPPQKVDLRGRWMVSDYDTWMAGRYQRMLAMATAASLPREMLEEIADKLLAQAKERAQAQGVEEVTAAYAHGPPAPQILRHAHNVDADAIVVACRGLTALEDMSVGSVCHQIQRRFPGIVLTVR